jgi:Sortase domain
VGRDDRPVEVVRQRADPLGMEIPTRRRRALSTVLALFLAIESVSAVAAVAVTPRGAVGGEAAPVAAAARGARTVATAVAPAVQSPAASRTMAPAIRRMVDAPDAPRTGPARTTAPAIRARTLSAKAVLAISKPKSKSSSSGGGASAGASGGSGTVRAGALKGRNHFWFPAVGINRSVNSFPCSRSRAPDNLVYRWGCAGRNNVYLMGHAHSVFSPLHNAYVSGRLKVGMKAYYADNGGRVHTYKVKWWKLTKPTTSASWAWASQSVPSMTLQTCVGSNSEYRLMVRLVEVR